VSVALSSGVVEVTATLAVTAVVISLWTCAPVSARA
jgi:hypothetical protein